MALVFSVNFVVVYFVTDARWLLLCLFSFFSTNPRDWLGITSPKLPVLCRVGCKTLPPNCCYCHKIYFAAEHFSVLNG